MLVIGATTISIWFFIGRTLQQLDPSQAIPQRVKSALDTLAEGLLVIDRSGVIVLANSAFSIWLGRDSEDLIGQDAAGLPWTLEGRAPTALELPGLTAIDAESIQEGFVLDLTTSDGKTRSLVVNASPVLGVDGLLRRCTNDL